MIGGVKPLQERQGADAVDARVRPEVDQHHVPSQPSEGQGPSTGGVEPLLRVGELRRHSEVREGWRLDAGNRGPGGRRHRHPGSLLLALSESGGRAQRRQAVLDAVRVLQCAGRIDQEGRQARLRERLLEAHV